MSELTKLLPENKIREVENGDSPQAFRELLRFAAETCLSGPFLVEQKELLGEARVVSQLGTRGLRAAIDLARGTAINISLDNGMRSDSPIRQPELFGDGTDFDVMAHVKGFGEGLLREAYDCLGTDVDKYIEQFAQADSDEDQIEALGWLHERLKQLAKGDAQADPDRPFYHPIRLSPKVIGMYPYQKTAPTCLSVSMIAASFLHQARADMLHAGVMQSQKEYAVEKASMFLKDLPRYAEDIYGVSLPSVFIEVMNERVYDILEQAHRDNGYHAAVLTRLKSGTWVQIDPNFNASCVVDTMAAVQLDDAYDKLQSLSDVAPGLETTIYAPLGTTSQLAEMMIKGGDKTSVDIPDEVRQLLLDPEAESVPERIKEAFIVPFFTAKRDEGGLNQVWDSHADFLVGSRVEGVDTYDNTFYDLFNKYVLWSAPLAEVLQKFREDEGYLQRRLEDIRALPFIMTASIVLKSLKAGHEFPGHTMIEVGLPATRVGAAVLSDFASHSEENGLTSSFRLSHWTSQVPITETITDALPSETQRKVLANNMQHLRMGLRYTKTYGIVKKQFLEEHGLESDDHGHY
jgi:hypothetical protein